MNEQDEEDLENKINFIAETTLGGLKGIFVEKNLDDRQATLSLMYFLDAFIKLGWKDNNPIDVLNNVIEVMKLKGEFCGLKRGKRK